MWHSLSSTNRHAQKLISGPNLTTKIRILSFTGHNSGLLSASSSSLNGADQQSHCWRCEAEEETTAYILSVCEALASLRRTYLGSSSLDLRDTHSLRLGAFWNFTKGTGLPWPGIRLWGTMQAFKLNSSPNQVSAFSHIYRQEENQLLIYCVLFRITDKIQNEVILKCDTFYAVYFVTLSDQTFSLHAWN